MIWALVFGFLLTSSLAVNLPGNVKNILNVEGNKGALLAMSDDVAKEFENEYVSFLKTGQESRALKQLSQYLAQSHTREVFTEETENLSPADQFFMCTTCRATVNVLTRMFRDGGEYEDDAKVKAVALELCRRLDIQTDEVCENIFDIKYPIMKYILDNGAVDSRSFCGTFLAASFCNVTNAAFNWKLDIDANNSEIEGPKEDIPEKGNSDLRIVHITDIHYDPLYEPGSLAECDEPTCCQRHKSESEGTSKAAGYWGDYRNCDTPWHTVVDSLDHIKRTHEKIDYIYHTGDVIDHGIWLTSREKNTKNLKDVNAKIKETFGNIPVYPTIGNHENHPLNMYAPINVPEDNFNPKWLYELLADLWSAWLPTSAQETIKIGGYYTVSPRTGFRVIALNNNDCYIYNYWIFYDGNFLTVQLKWLHDTLLQAEKDKEHVHILAHIPTGSKGCWDVWSREFGRIVVRFSKTISGIFNGHTHRDELSVYYSNKTTAVNVAWNGGSLTPFVNKNPNYKIYQVEPASYQVVEQEIWFFNLTKANLNVEKSPEWQLEYKLTEAFELKDLSPGSIDRLLTKFAENPKLLRKYWQYYVVQGDPKLKKGCNAACLKKLLCILAGGDNTQVQRCEDLKEILQNSLDSEKPEDDGDRGGAASILALKLTAIFSIYLGLKLIF